MTDSTNSSATNRSPSPSQSPRGRGEPGPRRKRTTVWKDIHTFNHPESGLAAIITERTRGTIAYSFSIVHKDDRGDNKFIPYPLPGEVTDSVEDIILSLAAGAKEFIEAKIAENAKEAEKRKEERANKSASKNKDRRDKRGGKQPQGGLSVLAKKDAAAGGHDYVGPTNRRRAKKKSARSGSSS